MKKNILTGALAAREYIHFFRDPVGCMRTLYRQRGKLVALGPIAFGEPTTCLQSDQNLIGRFWAIPRNFALLVNSFTARKTPRNAVFASASRG